MKWVGEGDKATLSKEFFFFGIGVSVRVPGPRSPLGPFGRVSWALLGVRPGQTL